MTGKSGPLTSKPPGFAGKVVEFADYLKGRGFRIFQSSVHDALRSLCHLGLSKGDCLTALRTNLVTNDLEWAQFEGLFEAFWGRFGGELDRPHPEPLSDMKPMKESPLERLFPENEVQGSVSVQDSDGKQWLEGTAYSPVSVVEKKDLSCFDKADIQVAKLAVKKMVKPFKINVSRRLKKSSKPGDLDFPRIIRKSMKSEGIPLDLFYKRKKKRLKRMVILADVSGSMDRYARFVMPFIMGMKGIGSRSEVFVFATTLTRITYFVRQLSIEKALERIALEAPDWSGGTRIGHCLHQFNEKYGQSLLNRRTLVVILSDGWDLGGKDLLRREMTTINRRAHCVIWLNPLAGDPDYEPVCQGMRVALPYVDHFLPANSLQNLKRVGKLMSRLMIH